MAQHILYIDDVPDHLALMQRVIESSISGVVVDTCETVAGAELALSRHCYDLVIADINLRDSLGTRVIEKLLDNDPAQPAMLLSEYVGENLEKQVKALQERGVPCWPKISSVDISEMLGSLKELLARRPCCRLKAGEDRPDFCRFKACMHPDHGGEVSKRIADPKLVLIRPAIVAA